MMASSRTIRIEFFGIPRARAGVPDATLELPNDTATFASVLSDLAQRFPAFGSECVAESSLAKSFAANVQGERFLISPDDVVSAGDTVLIFSADAGG